MNRRRLLRSFTIVAAVVAISSPSVLAFSSPASAASNGKVFWFSGFSQCQFDQASDCVQMFSVTAWASTYGAPGVLSAVSLDNCGVGWTETYNTSGIVGSNWVLEVRIDFPAFSELCAQGSAEYRFAFDASSTP